MSKKNIIIISVVAVVLIAAIIAGIAIYNNNNSKQQNNYTSQKTATNNNQNENKENTNDNTKAEETKAPEPEPQPEPTPEPEPQKTMVPVEEQIATFSTNITSKDPARQNNIQITCSRLNGTTIENGETFSFCNTLGPSTSAKGYQEADIFDAKGNKKKGLGGGNCQISSTLYNAVLAAPGVTVVERHAHSSSVPYVPKGKDAAVAYGSYDLKFKNNTGSTIKIVTETNSQVVSAALVKITYQQQ